MRKTSDERERPNEERMLKKVEVQKTKRRRKKKARWERKSK